MSARALQRVAVRMFFDPNLVASVYAGEGLEDVALTADERGWLTRPDRRRWLADPLRRTRALHGLLEQFPVSAAFAGVGSLDGFFSSTAFHDCVQQRGSMATTFGDWLSVHFRAPTPALARFESAVVEVLRAPAKTPPSPFDLALRWRTAPWVAPLTLPEGTIALYARVHARLYAHAQGPVAALLAADSAPAAPESTGLEHGLLERGDEGAVFGHAAEGLVEWLHRMRAPHPAEAALGILCELGADDRDEALELARKFAIDGLLVPLTDAI